MKKLIVTILVFFVTLISSSPATAQSRYFTKTGFVSFDCSTSVEDITATNAKAVSVLDTKTGAFEMGVLMNGFEFKRALMQEHFNENYVESDRFPKSTFKGKVDNFSSVDISTPGTYAVTISGILTIHGVSKPVSSKGKLITAANSIKATSAFSILLSDYNIEIPSVVKDKISNTVTISLNLWLEPLK